jgi:hypothetical protein
VLDLPSTGVFALVLQFDELCNTALGRRLPPPARVMARSACASWPETSHNVLVTGAFSAKGNEGCIYNRHNVKSKSDPQLVKENSAVNLVQSLLNLYLFFKRWVK